ncbi:hypothetical protein VPNG_07406 [Cytospora leucostoma]|uniref:Uncharacterized protein n=1 Tax=Cytospora leucostoma TaxID=1230097 RepID=A0A423WMB5_9PEZI|nr:hypothetical protein VPNG_07406 [Cytospora leucostoma]
MGLWDSLTKKIDNRLQKKAKEMAKDKVQQQLQVHGADYGQQIGSAVEKYAGRSQYTKKYAPQIGKYASQGATTGIGAAVQQAGHPGTQNNQNNQGSHYDHNRTGMSRGQRFAL